MIYSIAGLETLNVNPDPSRTIKVQGKIQLPVATDSGMAASEVVCTVTQKGVTKLTSTAGADAFGPVYIDTSGVAAVAATASLATTSAITLTSAALTAARNATTLETVVNAAAANPTNTVLVAFTGTAAAIVVTVTPNDGTNNGATPVTVTSANLRELITTGAITGKTATITDASSLRVLQTATGGNTTVLAHGGNGDGVTATFSGGADYYYFDEIAVTLSSSASQDQPLNAVRANVQVEYI